jgi:hypothetical protein
VYVPTKALPKYMWKDLKSLLELGLGFLHKKVCVGMAATKEKIIYVQEEKERHTYIR